MLYGISVGRHKLGWRGWGASREIKKLPVDLEPGGPRILTTYIVWPMFYQHRPQHKGYREYE